MNILLLGSGGREHALARKITQSPHCGRLYIAPGNGGTVQHGTNVPVGVNNFGALEAFVNENGIDLIVAGPEDPLVNGVYDYFAERGIPVVGPSKAAAQLEGSKAFSKKFMQRHGIPTAGYAEFTEDTFEAGLAYLQQHALPIVLKADGLAAGKGVVICQSHAEALAVFTEMIKNRQFGEASSRVVVEEFLQGIEISVFVLTDGKDYRIIGHAKDYKRIGEGDTGPNTGGMGCVSPVPFADAVFMQKVVDRIIAPTINGLHTEGLVYKGFVFFGLISVGGEPFVIEYNCRMGDPETEVVMPRLRSDLVELFIKLHKGELASAVVELDEKAAATVMVVSGGYPGDYQKGKFITLPDAAEVPEAVFLYHAGTAFAENGTLVTNGGRVLAVTAMANTIQQAAAEATAMAGRVSFDGSNYRSDIGYEFA
ncbi:MAG: phosphoribosylamine--glycine ligase, partial [Chitinophagaceae bacterium]|nr:phosphoribosylamine--glycine ligase [Chitinophagaceae bacterium]